MKKQQLGKKEAEAIIAKEKQERAQTCANEIDAILKKYNCTLDPRPFIAQGGVIAATVGVVAND